MDSDDLEPLTKKPKPKDLDAMGIDALEDYIAELEGEIARARAAIAHKGHAKLSAESVFKK